MSYRVRHAELEDMAQITALRVQCNQKKSIGNAQNGAQTINDNQRLYCATFTFVCEEEGVLRGFVAVIVSPPLPLAGLVRPSWNIIELCVPEEDAQVGAALLQEVSHRANEGKGYVVAVW